MNKLALALVGTGLAAAAAGGVAAHAISDDQPVAARTTSGTTDSSGARTRLDGLTPAAGDPVPAGLESAAPTSGTTGTFAGPFDDRFRWQRLQLRGSTVTGAVRVTSDVSDVLELQVVAGFYDAQGHYLGLARFSHHLDEDVQTHTGPPSEVEPFTIKAPAAFRDRVASATVNVPVLVNE